MKKEIIAASIHRKRFFPIAPTVLLLPFGATIAHAHPGHDLLDQGIAHALTNADHLFLLAAIGGGLFCFGRAVQRRVPRRVLQSLGVGLVLGAVVLWKCGA